MVALMTDPLTNEPVGIHRTFLAADGSGKATGTVKQMLGRAGIIRLVRDEAVTVGLGIAEGIENALCVMQRDYWSPVWACGSAGAVAKFPLLAGIETLTVFPDLDDAGAGIGAARTCMTRWIDADRQAQSIRPPNGRDWCDVAGSAG